MLSDDEYDHSSDNPHAAGGGGGQGDSDSDSDQDLFDENRRRRNRERAQEEAIYGVFADDSIHNDDYGFYHRKGQQQQRRRKQGGRREKDNSAAAAGGINIAPQFVKGQTLKDTGSEEELEELDGKDEDKKDNDSDSEDEDMFEKAVQQEAAMPQEEEEQTAAEKALEEQLKQKQEEANTYFMSLLKKGKGKGADKKRPPLSSNHTEAKEASGGLGFHKSGAGGLGYSGSDDKQNGNHTAEGTPSFAPASAGLGMHFQSFGRQEKKTEEQQQFKKDPNLGTWEKHTKGIGLKLLAKMGYKGSGGLGAKRRKKLTADGQEVVESDDAPVKTGISKPVEVVVRPANLGLGYGNFKEATKLKTNQQIEAEVRGIDLEKKRKEEEEKKKAQMKKQQQQQQQQGVESSALPSVNDLMQQKSWKRGSKQQQASRKRPKRTIIPYQELLEKQASKPSVVIDMRGPSTTIPSSGAHDQQPQEVPLAEELLHNVSLLLNTYENKIHSCSHFVRSTKQKVESLESDIASMERTQQENEGRITKLNKVLDTLDKIESILNDKDTNAMGTVQTLVQQLEATFTAEEKAKLRFFDVLAPSLLEPVLEARLEKWDPLNADAKETKETMEVVVNLCKNYPTSNKQDLESVYLMMQTMFTNLLLPRVKHALESQRWDPIHDVEIGLQLYEHLCEVAAKATPTKPQSSELTRDDNDGHILPPEDDADDDADRSKLKALVQEEIIHKTVYFKLMRALGQWKPALNVSGVELLDRPSTWILPWLPYLDHRSIFPTLLADCKRKLKSAMSFLHKYISGDEDYCRAALQTLQPWCNVFPRETLPSLVSTSIISRLASSVATAAVALKGKNKQDVIGCPSLDWTAVDMSFQMHSAGLLSDKEFLSIIEGELLSPWVSRVQSWLAKKPDDCQEVAKTYIEWRLRLFTNEGTSDKHDRGSTSYQCLHQDTKICAIFYSVLLMIQAAHQSNLDALEDLRPAPTNVRAVLSRRSREERDKAEEELLRMDATGLAGAKGYDMAGVEARVRAAQRNSGHTPTFREVIEEFAKEHNVLFQPRMGSNATKDGKPVFLFGTIPVYLDKDVVFVFQKSEWNPTPLGDLAKLAQQAEAKQEQ